MQNDLKSLPQKRLIRILAGSDPLLQEINPKASTEYKKMIRRENAELKRDAELEIRHREKEKNRLHRERKTKIVFRGDRNEKPIYLNKRLD